MLNVCSRRIAILILWIFIVASGYSQVSFDTSTLIKNNPGIYSLVVSLKGKNIYHRSFNGKKENELFNNQSLTKSIEAVLIGIAIDKGYIKSLDTKIADILPTLKDDSDNRKLNITLVDVMNQASGWHENLGELPLFMAQDNPSAFLLKQPLGSDPGKELHYNNAASHLISVILTKTTGLTTFQFARKYLFEPLDIHRVEWPQMKDGYNDGSGLLSVRLSTADVNRIGIMLLNGGSYKGNRIVSQKWVQTLFKPFKTYPAPWGLQNTTYALCFYHKNYNNEAITYGMGWGGQFLILIPGLNAVISVNQSVSDETAIQQSDLFMDRIFPLIFDWIRTAKNNSRP